MTNTKEIQQTSEGGSGDSACSAPRILRLTLKKRWFYMIASGEKREEYREPSKWILSRLSGKEYDRIEFKNGYGQTVPMMEVEFLGWEVKTGYPEWGAAPGRPYITIKLGKVLSLQNAPEHQPAD